MPFYFRKECPLNSGYLIIPPPFPPPPPPICSRQAAVVLYRQRRARVKNELYICHFFHDISSFM
ncbi:hypothetical protein ACN71_28810 [Escherichia coli]|nr:hypothetical protein ACN71_28810 [Escherichia coli]